MGRLTYAASLLRSSSQDTAIGARLISEFYLVGGVIAGLAIDPAVSYFRLHFAASIGPGGALDFNSYIPISMAIFINMS